MLVDLEHSALGDKQGLAPLRCGKGGVVSDRKSDV
jgi:hypothetical protein